MHCDAGRSPEYHNPGLPAETMFLYCHDLGKLSWPSRYRLDKPRLGFFPNWPGSGNSSFWTDGRWKNNGQRGERPSLLQPTSHLWFLLVKQTRFLTYILWPRERCVRACKCACALPSPLAAWATEPGRPIQAGQPNLTWRGKSGQRPVRVPVTVALFFILS
ncbi:hypothetical protein CCUS01_14452 [Colletotrichum cuscutae]|uniref:Uncharacterized protein n=1 Tax=Colletotrichum cuscutae TaxID=1209917 RepID=A0AAI9Y9A4_9PEZI|nr:hypothetical protein CCUS01_14452 [Colletotrichum cuscutae]